MGAIDITSDERLMMGRSETVHTETANVLLLGDRVNLFADQPGAAFGWATVTRISEDEVELMRPYVHTSDFAMGSYDDSMKLQSYFGHEIVKLYRHNDRKLAIVFRASVPK